MFIDRVMSSGMKLTKLSPEANDIEREAMEAQLRMLGEFTPSFDVWNVYSTLNPNLVLNPQPGSPAERRNTEAVEKREETLLVASKAPIYAPYNPLWFEHKYSDAQRLGYLCTFSHELEKWTVSLVFDSLYFPGGIEYIPNAFELLLGDDEMFGGYTFKNTAEVTSNPEDMEALQFGSELVRTCLQMINWVDDDPATGTQLLTLSNKKQKKSQSSGSRATTLSTPTIIRFEPFMKSRKAHATANGGSMSEAAQHLVRACRPIYTMQRPLGGALTPEGKPKKLTLGVNYGMLKRKQHLRGNPEKGKKAKVGIITVGNVHGGSAPTSPTSTPPSPGLVGGAA
jgi:hypothetical protein